MDKIKSVDHLYDLIADDEVSWVEVKIGLGGCFSRHVYSYDEGLIDDFSYVDESDTLWTKEEFASSFYGEAIGKGAMFIDTIEKH